jgi:hypothetical protein
MRTSLNNIKAIDDYLLGSTPPGDRLLFEANLLLNKGLADDTEHQQNTYATIRQYGRRRIKEEIIAAQNILATAPQHSGFMQRILNLFK